ncbi:MAG TPA: hypothetical protein VGN98_07000, partial [Tianweitania sediminis]|nr:hypothetical protein [Tianweitania sediminis]
MLWNNRRIILGCAVSSGLLLSSAASAVELKLSDQFPAGHTISKEGTQAFFDHIEANPEADLQISHFPGEQLGKAASMLELVRNRVSDISMVGMSYITDQMPLATMMELPALYKNSFDGYGPYIKLAEEEIAAIDFERNNVKLLWV